MHELSLGTWFIHIATLMEWTLAIVFVALWGKASNNKAFIWFAIAMLPNLASAMAAITWHIFDNTETLNGMERELGLYTYKYHILLCIRYLIIPIKNQNKVYLLP